MKTKSKPPHDSNQKTDLVSNFVFFKYLTFTRHSTACTTLTLAILKHYLNWKEEVYHEKFSISVFYAIVNSNKKRQIRMWKFKLV